MEWYGYGYGYGFDFFRQVWEVESPLVAVLGPDPVSALLPVNGGLYTATGRKVVKSSIKLIDWRQIKIRKNSWYSIYFLKYFH